MHSAFLPQPCVLQSGFSSVTVPITKKKNGIQLLDRLRLSNITFLVDVKIVESKSDCAQRIVYQFTIYYRSKRCMQNICMYTYIQLWDHHLENSSDNNIGVSYLRFCIKL